MKVLTRPDEKIMILCPKGHKVFETGILVKTLYKSHGIRIGLDQLVKEGYDWSDCIKMMQRAGVSLEAIEKGKSKEIGLCPTYQLTQHQMDSMTKVKCGTCFPWKGKCETK